MSIERARVLNLIGLALNLIGIVMLFRWGMPFHLQTGGTYLLSTGVNKDLLATEHLYAGLGYMGLSALVIGTGLQMWAAAAVRVRPPYDAATQLREPWREVYSRINTTVILAVLLAATGIVCDCKDWRPLGGTHWFQRSGSLIVLCGAYLAFKSGAVLIKYLPMRDAQGRDTDHGMTNPNPEQGTVYGMWAFAVLAAGTLIWGFGDIPL